MASSLRLDIQGLRALAVALVVIFHLVPAVMPGGYIGVDVFFVISGFLITAHLLREVASTGTVKLGRFWARRARRLLPAALVVLAVSAAAAVLLLPHTVRIQNLWEVAFAAIYILNWNLAANSVDYLGAHNSPSIAQHYWSLSVEEQFYIVWPLLIIGAIWIAAKLFKTSPRRAVLIALIIVFVASLAFSVYETARSQPSAYFLTTTRAWEFAVGGIVAMAPTLRLRTPIHAAVSWVLLGAVAGSALLFNAQTPFPGWIALIPVLGTAGLLWVGDSEHAWSPQYVSHAGPVQFIGDTSYSIYLWHWPAIIVFIALEGRRPGWKWMIILTVAIVTLAWLSKRFVEDPVRHGPGLLRRNGPTFLATAAAMIVVVVIAVVPAQVLIHQQRVYAETIAAAVADESGCFGAYALSNECAEPYEITATVNPEATMQDNLYRHLDLKRCVRVPVEGQSEIDCVYPGAGPTTVLFGDSHAQAVMPAFQAIAAQAGSKLEVHIRTGCTGFEGPLEGATGNDRLCREWGQRTLDAIIADESVGQVALSVRTVARRDERPNADVVMQRLIDAGKRVAVIRMAPGMESIWPATAAVTSAPACIEAGGSCDWNPPADYDDWLVADAHSVGDVPVIDTWNLLCRAGACHAVIGGTIVYFDDNHLSPTFARTMAPWLRSELDAVGWE